MRLVSTSVSSKFTKHINNSIITWLIKILIKTNILFWKNKTYIWIIDGHEIKSLWIYYTHFKIYFKLKYQVDMKILVLPLLVNFN